MDDKCFDALEEFLNSKESPNIVFKASSIFTDDRPVQPSKTIVSHRRKLANRIGRRVSRDKVWAFRGYNITLYGGKTNPRRYLAVLAFDQLLDIYSKDFLNGNFRDEEMQAKMCMLLKVEEFDPLKGVTPSCGFHNLEHIKQLICAKAQGICPLGCGVFYEDKLDAHMKFVEDMGVDDTKRSPAKDLLDGVDI